MRFWASPLRYPGGKGLLGAYFADLIELNSLNDGCYVEPYAGGAGAAWYLLLKGYVDSVVINDASRPVAAFWRSVFEDTEKLLRLVNDTKVTIREHKKQKKIFANDDDFTDLEVGFSAFFLNRTNRSGIFNAGPIGGLDQTGNYKIDARYNKKGLTERINSLALYAPKVKVMQKDALDFISQDVVQKLKPQNCLIYLDPPYYEQGRKLYMDYYIAKDHQQLATRLKKIKKFKWLLSYDESDFIRNLYSDKRFTITPMSIAHSANVRKKGRELLITPKQTIIPPNKSLEVA